ncbi:MAG: Na+/H+ antiporter subunit E [Candidatus Schekmanbacteria bacterium]|nr:Na+/H+ antiporter subunit E [Candidatus Schekmanbacteria bacterium]
MKRRRFLVVVLTLFIFWLTLGLDVNLSGIILGIIVAVTVAAFTWSLIDEWLVPLKWRHAIVWRLGLYVARRLKYIIHANIDLAERLLDPKLPINPAVICLKHDLQNPLARAILANTVSLTPGTLTVEIDENDIYIHFLAEEYLDNILSSNLSQQIKHALFFDEED